MRSFRDLLAERAVVFDGGMGSMLYQRGVFISRCFDELNLLEPELVRGIHAEYLAAGSEVLETNTFSANAAKLEQHGIRHRLAEINRAGVRIAREVAGDKAYVAGSIGPLGIRIEPWGPTSIDEAKAMFREQAQALLEAGVDVIVLETFSDVNEIWQAVRAVRELSADVFLVAQMTLGEDGDSLYGTPPEVFAQRLEAWGVDVVGVNCSVGPAIMLDALERMAPVVKRPLSAMPNAGLPRKVDGRNLYLASPEYMASYVKRFIASGARIVGGCCGTTPAHIRAIHQALLSSRSPARTAVRTIGSALGTAALHAHPSAGTAVAEVPLPDRSRLAARIAAGKFVKIVEVTPPRGLDDEAVFEGANHLVAKGLEFLLVSEPPRASARISCLALAQLLERRTGVESLLHYSCRGRDLMEMQSELIGAYALGLRNIVCETGAAPTLEEWTPWSSTINLSEVDSIGVTNMVRRLNEGFDLGASPIGTPTGWHLGVVANPTAVDLDEEVRRFEWKVDAGAQFAVTRPVFDVSQMERFLKRIGHCRIPILLGLRPLVTLRLAEYLANEVPGTVIADAVLGRMRSAADRSPEAEAAEGVAIAIQVLSGLRGAVEGVVVATPSGQYEAVAEVLAACD